jgi:hypothetical protein
MNLLPYIPAIIRAFSVIKLYRTHGSCSGREVSKLPVNLELLPGRSES